MDERKQVKLSKTILHMKFMKKSKERVEKDEDDAEGHAMYSNEITEEMKRLGNIIFVESNITNCKNLIDGRLSFGGMNPEIERMMVNDFHKKKSETEKEKDISDATMAKEYSGLVDTMSDKFKSKRNREKSRKH